MDGASSRLRGIALPAEHGGWGLTLEPVVLGLAAVPSLAGVGLGLAALFAFLTRTPLKLSLADRRRDRILPRTATADRLALAYGAAGVASLAWAAAASEGPFWIPLLAALPPVSVQIWFDMRSRSRHLLPELAGPVGIGAFAAAIVLAGGESWMIALGLWLVVGLRSVASVTLVRAQLRRAKGQVYRSGPVHLVDLAAAAIGLSSAIAGFLPWGAAAALSTLPVVGWWELRRPPIRAVVVGVHQTILGVVIVTMTAVAFRSGL